MTKSSFLDKVCKAVFVFIFLMFTVNFYAQEQTQKPLPKAKTDSFWENVSFGGGLGMSISNDYTDFTVAPSAIYTFNDYVSLGAGLQYSRLKQKDLYSSHVVGGSLIGLFNPVEFIQVSAELEEANVNTKYIDINGNYKRSFWNTGLYFGLGYRQEGITIGGRINVLFDKDKDIYGSAFMPFVRVFF